MGSPTPFKRATEILGPLSTIADLCGVTSSAVQQWGLPNRRVPAEHCVKIEQATGGKVTRYELRPDVFGEPPTQEVA